jgi:hypothetical protein
MEAQKGEAQRGLCRLSIVPVRAEGRESSEMVTQLLFGDHYTVLSETPKGDWLQIRVFFDGYEGWISSRQHHPISEEHFQELSSLPYQACGEICSPIQLQQEQHYIVYGSLLPLTANELFDLSEQVQFKGKCLAVKKIRDFAVLKEIAFQYINSPYLWGGKTPFGIDCSGFVQMVFKLCGYQLSRDASQQALQGKKIASLAAANKGDLAFFHNTQGKIVHVGIILENGQIIHASGKVRVDQLDEKGIFDKEKGIYTHDLCLIKRFIT